MSEAKLPSTTERSPYGIAGITGPLLAGLFKDAASMGATPQVWMTPLLIAGVACLIGALIMLFTNAPRAATGIRAGRGSGFKPKLAMEKL